jgi:hypothetical protein
MNPRTTNTASPQPVVTIYRPDDVTGKLGEAIARTGAREGDRLVIEQDGEEVRVQRVAPLEAGRIYTRHEAMAALKALLRLE